MTATLPRPDGVPVPTRVVSSRPVAVSGKSRRLAALDGLRGIAVVGVLLFHAFPDALPGGFVGVDVFFVLSGFLITGGLLREQTRGQIWLARFWLRRARRLLPALVLLVLACGTAVAAIGGDPAVGFGAQLAAAAGFVTNWRLIATGNSYFAESSPPILQHLWSLAVEEQFYVVWPLVLIGVMICLRRNRQRLLLVCGLGLLSVVAMALAALTSDIGRAYYGTDTHCFGLLAGAALALARQQGLVPRRITSDLSGALALVGLLLAIVVLPGSDRATYVLGLPAVAGLTVLIVATVAGGDRLLARGLGVAPLRQLGLISYGLYLWHWPVLVLLRYRFPGWAHDHPGWCALAVAAVSLAAATASYVCVEQPVQRLGFRGYAASLLAAVGAPGPRRPAVAGLALAVVVAGAATATASLRGPGQTTAQAQISAGERAIAAARYQPLPTAPAPAVRPPDSSAKDGPPPRPKQPLGRRTTAIGDSVMLASAPGLLARFPGIDIHAKVSRQASAVPGLMRGLKRAHRLRSVVLIGIGTNGYLGAGTLQQIRQVAGPRRQLVFVNVFVDRPWATSVNRDLTGFVDHDKRARLVDWRSAIASHLNDLGPDRIHPGPTGARRYAAAVAAATKGL